LKETKTLKIRPMPSIFYFSLKKMVKNHDIIMIVEGSCYMDTWSPVLLGAFLWATSWAKKYDKPSIAYAVDSGPLSEANEKRVRHEASKTGLIIMRTQAAANRLKEIGVKAPIEVTADTAFCFRSKPKDKHILQKLWPEISEKQVVGLALINPYCWPVKFRLIGKKKNCYRWPYYFSQSEQRKAKAEKLSQIFANEADRIIEKHMKAIALICMESVDESFANETFEKIRNKKWVKIFSSKNYNASEMNSILCNLNYLISMRYHACVLSMASGVPMIGIAHDLRIPDLFKDLGLMDLVFEYDKITPDLLNNKVEQIINSNNYQKLIFRSYHQHQLRAKKNSELLVKYLKTKEL
jgi:polysaccharide pyruvyl transferase WcaK-like protein